MNIINIASTSYMYLHHLARRAERTHRVFGPEFKILYANREFGPEYEILYSNRVFGPEYEILYSKRSKMGMTRGQIYTFFVLPTALERYDPGQGGTSPEQDDEMFFNMNLLL